jgi:hypothetical protein
MKNLPSKQQEEWRKLLTGEIDVPLQNFYFKTKVLQIREQINHNKISLDEGVDEIYQMVYGFCQAKYVADDIERIFGIKIETTPVQTEDTSANEILTEQNKEKSDDVNHLETKPQEAVQEEKTIAETLKTENEKIHKEIPKKEESDKKKVILPDAITKQKDLKFQPKETVKSALPDENPKSGELPKSKKESVQDLDEERKKVRAEIEKRLKEIEESKQKKQKNPEDILKEIKKDSEMQKRQQQAQMQSSNKSFNKKKNKKEKKSFWRDLFDL